MCVLFKTYVPIDNRLVGYSNNCSVLIHTRALSNPQQRVIIILQ